MSTDLITTTSTGTNVWVTTRRATGDRIVILEDLAALKDLRWCEAGRLASFNGHLGLQPASNADWVLGVEALRAIADLIERETLTLDHGLSVATDKGVES